MHEDRNAGGFGIVTAILLTTGTILGSAIVFTIKETYAGAAVLPMLTAALAIMFINLPMMATGAALPAPGGPYMHMTRLIHPAMALFDIAAGIARLMLIAVLCMYMSDAIERLLPDMSGNLIMILVLIVLGFIALFGTSAAARFGDLLTLALLIVLVICTATGMNPDSNSGSVSLFNFGEPDLLMVMVMMMSTSMFVIPFANSMIIGDIGPALRDSSKNGFRAYITSLLLSFVIMAVAILTARPLYEAPLFSVLLLLAALTAINGLMTGSAEKFGMHAADGVLPAAFSRSNNNGAKPVCIIFIILVSGALASFLHDHILAIITHATVLTVISALAGTVPTFVTKRRYPNAYKRSPIRPHLGGTIFFAIIGAILLLSSCFFMVASFIENYTWLLSFVLIGLSAAYLFIRKAYLRGHGIDLFKTMKEAPQIWIDIENS